LKKILNFAFIGGDLRQISAISALIKEGHIVKTYGLNPIDPIYKADSVAECTKNAEVTVLPLPYSKDTEESIDTKTLNTPLWNQPVYMGEVLDSIKNCSVILAGKVDPPLVDICDKKGILVADYASREEFEIMNAIPTAEGAIELAMANTSHTIHNSNCLVAGFGRIGKVLSRYLHHLGAKVTVSARKPGDFSWIFANGYSCINTSDLSAHAEKFDIIFNTIPHLVLDSKVLGLTKKTVLIIDLASRPGGVDFDAASTLCRKTIHALSLPGKVAPVTAGRYIRDTVYHMMEELGV